MAIVCVLVALDVLVLTIWEFTDPLHITFYNKTLEAIVSDIFISPPPSQRTPNIHVV